MQMAEMIAAQAAQQRRLARTGERELSFSRVFAAPRELVWQALTEPEHVIHWWGPDGFTNTVHLHELRTGGRWNLTMHGPDGTDYPNYIIFDEIIDNSRLAFHHVQGEGSEQVHHTSLFEVADTQGGTLVTMKLTMPSAAALDELIGKYGVLEGGLQCIRRWGEFVMAREADRQGGFLLATPSDTEILVLRTFKAAPALLFEACTRPEHLRNWWGGCGQLTTKLCEAEPVVGGRWRIVLSAPDGTEHGFHGEYLELVPGVRCVQSFVYEQVEGAESLETAEFQPVEGGTRLLITIRHRSREARDAHLHSGMEGGMRQSHEALDRLLEKLQSAGAV
ncbi:MAG: SRPBCC family protein [bacterium]